LKPQDLTEHNCINLRMPTYGGPYAWEFENGRRELKVRVDGQLVFNTIQQRVDAALAGLGLAYMVEDIAQPLRAVLAGSCASPSAGFAVGMESAQNCSAWMQRRCSHRSA
jgi:DNA-binding transcriptional LysR family regulator